MQTASSERRTNQLAGRPTFFGTDMRNGFYSDLGKQAFDKWRKFVQAVNNNQILNGLKSQKLLVALNKVPKRVLRDAVQRIIGDGSKVKGAIKQIYNTLLRKPKSAFDKWKAFIAAIKEKKLFDGLRSQKLKSALEGIVRRTLRNTSQRVIGGGNVIKGALKNLINGLRNIPKKALRKWQKFVEDVKNKKLFDGARSAKLKNFLDNILTSNAAQRSFLRRFPNTGITTNPSQHCIP